MEIDWKQLNILGQGQWAVTQRGEKSDPSHASAREGPVSPLTHEFPGEHLCPLVHWDIQSQSQSMILQPDTCYCQRMLFAVWKKCFRAFIITPAQFCVSRWKEKSWVGFRRQISMVSGDVGWITIRMKNYQMNIIAFTLRRQCWTFWHAFSHSSTIMRPEN